MKSPFSAVLAIPFAIIISCYTEAYAQQSKIDTTFYVRAVLPFPDSTDVRAVTFASYAINDSLTARLNISSPVFNNFYSQVPGLGLNLDDSYQFYQGNRAYLIDGMAYNQSIGVLSPLNNFEMNNVVAVLGSHGPATFGNLGTNGAYVLESKSGEGFTTGVAEVNSTTSYGNSEARLDNDFFEYDRVSIDFLQQATNVAWKKDFGKWDTRVSTYHQITKGKSNMMLPDASEKLYGVSANTGFKSRRLAARFIGKINYRNLAMQEEEERREKDALYSGQLKFQYVLHKKFSLHSSTLFQKRDWDRDNFGNKNQSWEKRLTTNLFFDYHFSEGVVTMKTFGGVQVDRWRDEYLPLSLPGYSVDFAKWDFKTTSALLGAEALIANVWAIRVVSTREFARDESAGSATFGSAVNFFQPGREKILDVKWRVSYGTGETATPIFPNARFIYFPTFFNDVRISGYGGRRKGSFETGLDITSARSKKTSSIINFYREDIKDDDAVSRGETFRKVSGLEFMSTLKSFVGEALLTNRILAGLAKAEYEQFDSDWHTVDVKFTSLALTNQVSWRMVYFSIVTNLIHNGEDDRELTFLKGNYYWIRNAGLMYRMDRIIRNADMRIGVVGRNLLISKPAGSFSPENLNFATKTISLNLTVTLR